MGLWCGILNYGKLLFYNRMDGKRAGHGQRLRAAKLQRDIGSKRKIKRKGTVAGKRRIFYRALGKVGIQQLSGGGNIRDDAHKYVGRRRDTLYIIGKRIQKSGL